MNVLSHLLLSGAEEEVILGNFIGDHVKGQKYLSYPEGVRKGIILHRDIDNFTDHHKVVIKSKSYFLETYGHYAGILVDIFYDHFLAIDWHLYSKVPLNDFLQDSYIVLKKYDSIVPPGVSTFLKRFIEFDWMRCYSSLEGIELVLHVMSLNTSLPEKTDEAIKIFNKNYDEFRQDFLIFFPELMEHVRDCHGIAIIR